MRSQTDVNLLTPIQPVAVTQPTSQVRLASAGRRKRVLLFSPDADLARFLILNLEDRLEIVRVHTLEEFEKGVGSSTPDLILIDLYTFSTDVVKQIDIIRRHAVAVPIIVLRAYVSLSPDMDRAIEELADHVFYKPVDVELITQAIEDQLK
jgi:DNA-binding NtrC family response regulator